MKAISIFLAGFVCVLCASNRTASRSPRALTPRAADAAPPSPICYPSDDASSANRLALRDALLSVLRIGRPRPVYISHCRNAKEGCEARMEMFAKIFFDAGKETGVDPFLLAAVAMRESGLNPDRVGKIGEMGLMQLHPHSRAGRETRLICKADQSACVGMQIFSAARLLQRNLRQCGSLPRALAAYNTGRCMPTDYARKVFSTRARIINSF